MAWIDRGLNLFRRRRLDADIDEELQFHLDRRTTDNLAAGMSSDEARRDAERRFGGLLLARERTRDANLFVGLETLARDLAYAARSLRRTPLVSTIIVASLALAIGAITAMFSIVNAVLLRSLPYPESDRIVILWTANRLNGSTTQYTSLPNVADWKARGRSFADLAAFREADGLLLDSTASSDAQWLDYAWVTDNFFSLLDRAAVRGRVFEPDDYADARHVAVVARSLAERRFGGDEDAIGKRMNVGGFDVEIIGVMPADFWFPTREVQAWLPAHLNPLWQRSRENRGTRFGAVFGRLAPGASFEQARVEMGLVASQLRQQYPAANENLDVNLVSLQVHVLGTTVPFMMKLLFGAVVCVLLIACANVANLLLARGVARRREMAVRAALGADRRRLARQLITESVLVSCAGGALGVIVLAWSMRALIAVAPHIPRLDETRVDGTVLLFTLAISVVTGVLFGIAPALRASSADGSALTAVRNQAGGASATLRGAFVAGQFALALVLLAGAGLLVRSLLAVHSVDSGFGDRSVVTARLRFGTSLPRQRRVALYQEVTRRIEQLPGVRAAGGVATMFWTGEVGKFGLRAIDGHPDTPRHQWNALTWTTVSGDYFQALGVPLVRGRFFEESDTKTAPPVVLINESAPILARRGSNRTADQGIRSAWRERRLGHRDRRREGRPQPRTRARADGADLRNAGAVVRRNGEPRRRRRGARHVRGAAPHDS
jgi:predicted permease